MIPTDETVHSAADTADKLSCGIYNFVYIKILFGLDYKI